MRHGHGEISFVVRSASKAFACIAVIKLYGGAGDGGARWISHFTGKADNWALGKQQSAACDATEKAGPE
jgi:hypothetical protein